MPAENTIEASLPRYQATRMQQISVYRRHAICLEDSNWNFEG
jgi:hypothetical protein